VTNASDGRVDQAQRHQRHRRAGRDRCDREEVHDHQANQKQHHVDARPEAESGRDFLSPRHGGRPRRQQDDREDGQRERGRVEDVHPLAIAVPANERLAGKAQRNQHELPVINVVFEPEEQVGAEDNRERPPADLIILAPRPGQQDVEGVGEQQLPRQQREIVVDRRPVVAPVGIDAAMAEGLDVMLGPRLDDDDAGSGAAARKTDRQPQNPQDQRRAGAQERPGQG
jgi:hypothetical protein